MSVRYEKRFIVFRDLTGRWRWKLMAANSKVLALSPQGYLAKESCISGIRLVARIAADTPAWNYETKLWESP